MKIDHKDRMKICAVTMVYRDYWALAQWYRHYARQLGGRNLYIVSHGYDPKVQEICPHASVLTIPRDTLDGFDRKRGMFLNAFQATLLQTYDRVIRTDADELICLDPDRYASFHDFFAQQDSAAIFSLGMEVTEVPADLPLRAADHVLKHRSHVMFTGHYSKAWAVAQPINLIQHGVETPPKKNRWFEFNMPPGVYLAHIKYANKQALVSANATRSLVASGDESGLPGKAWRDAHDHAHRHYDMFDSLPEVDWKTAESTAFQRLHDDPKRDRDVRLLRARKLLFKKRTILPDWFRTF